MFNILLFVLVSFFMYVVLAVFLGFMVFCFEDVGKVLLFLMILIIGGFFGVIVLGIVGDNFILKIGLYIFFILIFFMLFRVINGYVNGLEIWILFVIMFVFVVMVIVFIGCMYVSFVL